MEATFNMTGRRVLVLDAAFQPVSIVSWRRAFILLFKEPEAKKQQPKIVAYSKDGAVIGVRRDIRVPSVIQLSEVVPTWKRRVRFCRKSVFARDGFQCQFCGEQLPTEELTLDHVIPRAQGGTTVWENVVTACVPCNQRKGSRRPEEAQMALLRKPRKPSHVMSVEVKMDTRHIPSEWADYWTQALDK